MVLQEPDTVLGRTQASIVIALLMRSEAESGIETIELLPLNCSALPYLPVVHCAFAIVPLLPAPDKSLAVLPAPSSKFQAPTRLLAAWAGAVKAKDATAEASASLRARRLIVQPRGKTTS